MDSPGGGNGPAMVAEWQGLETFRLGTPKSTVCCKSNHPGHGFLKQSPVHGYLMAEDHASPPSVNWQNGPTPAYSLGLVRG